MSNSHFEGSGDIRLSEVYGTLLWLQDMDEVLAGRRNASRKHLRTRCLQALYTSTLVTRGYGFDNDTQQIRVLARINQQPIGTASD